MKENKTVQEKPVFAPKPKGKAYYVQNSNHKIHALYDESRSRIIQWSNGDEVSRVLTTILQSFNIDLVRDSARFQESEGFPDKI